VSGIEVRFETNGLTLPGTSRPSSYFPHVNWARLPSFCAKVQPVSPTATRTGTEYQGREVAGQERGWGKW
jgi:hypothetical protein